MIGKPRTYRLTAIGGAICTVAALALGAATSASAHGWIGGSNSDVVSRAALTSNSNRGPVQYEPQSIEGPKGFPAQGPADGTIAAGGNPTWSALDEQSSTRWNKNSVSTGAVRFGWSYSAPHSTSKWHYYMTKPGWDQNAPLTRASLELIGEVLHDGSAADSGAPSHRITVPDDRSGYHVILGVWDVADTANAFYQVVDVDVRSRTGGPAADTEAPSTPGGLHVDGASAVPVHLAWSASRDNVGVDHYRISRDGSVIGTTAATGYVDSQAGAGTTHTYDVVAVDFAQNASRSATLAVTTDASQPAPDPGSGADADAPTGLHTMAVSSDSVELMWTAGVGANAASGYSIERATADSDFQAVGDSAGTRFTDTGLTPGATYRYRVVAVDAAGVTSGASDELTVTTPVLSAEPDESGSLPAWDPHAGYQAGAQVVHNGSAYEAVQSHTGNGDPNWINAPSLWKKVQPKSSASSSRAAWDPRGTYAKGDVVTHGGSAYEAVQSHTGNGDPNWIDAPSLWKKIA